MKKIVWCAECQDQLAIGWLGVVLQGTDKVLDIFKEPLSSDVCAHCGNRASGVEVARNEETGEVAVIKFYKFPIFQEG